MQKSSERYKQFIQILKEELIPAMGCTEPIAIAYGAARAKKILGAKPDEIIVETSGNLVKNVKSVTVPNTGGLKGIKAAAVAGAIAGKVEKKLEVISEVTKEEQKQIKEYLDTHKVNVLYLDSVIPLDLIVTLKSNGHEARVRIAQYHTNIIMEEKDGEIIFNTKLLTQEEGLTDHNILAVEDIVKFADTVILDDVKDIIKRQIEDNMAIAEEGIKNSYGANIGSTLLANGSDLRTKLKAMAAAGSDARMSGCELPVVINSGSGNQGITVSVPVVIYAREKGINEERMYRALVLSNLLAIHQKTGIGRLSAYCGAVSAGSAAGAAICYLEGGTYKDIAHCLVNSLAISSGIICDGAKPSCAAKIAMAIESGLLSLEMLQTKNQFRDGEGIVKKGVENTIRNVGRLGRYGMRETDREIMKIMTDC